MQQDWSRKTRSDSCACLCRSFFTDVSRLWQTWKSLDRLVNQWCEKCPTNSIQTPTQTHTQTSIISGHDLYEGVFSVRLMMNVWRTTWCTDGIQLHNYWEIYETARQLRPNLHEPAVCFTSLHTHRCTASTHHPRPPPLLITAHAGGDSCCIACRLVIFPSGCSLPDFTAFTPKTALETLFTADCCARNWSRTSTNPKHRAAQIQRFKASVSKADAPANGSAATRRSVPAAANFCGWEWALVSECRCLKRKMWPCDE